MIGMIAGEALPTTLLRRKPTAGADTLLTHRPNAVLSGSHDHPVRFAASRAGNGDFRGGQATRHTQASFGGGIAWSRAGSSNSARTALVAIAEGGILPPHFQCSEGLRHTE